jgi:methyl-accepting chemotaxis protein
VSAVVEENTAATGRMAAGASEVTGLIENIASVSEENSAAVEQVSASAEEMSAQVEEVTASAQSLAEMAQALQELVRQFKLSAESTAEAKDVIETFKRAHLAWVKRAEAMIAGGQPITVGEVPVHSQCALGRWYSGRASQEWGHLMEYKAIDAPHRGFHDALAAFVAAAGRGRTPAAQSALAGLERASHAVVAALESLERRIAREAGVGQALMVTPRQAQQHGSNGHRHEVLSAR